MTGSHNYVYFITITIPSNCINGLLYGAKFLTSIIFAFSADGVSTMKIMLREIMALPLYLQTFQTLKGALINNRNIASDPFPNIGVSCILQQELSIDSGELYSKLTD